MLVNSSFLHLTSMLNIIFHRELMNMTAGAFNHRIIETTESRWKMLPFPHLENGNNNVNVNYLHSVIWHSK